MTNDYTCTAKGTILPIRDHIIAIDMDSENEKVVNGIIIPNESGIERGIHPRKARVYAVGPDQLDIKEGQWILVEHGRWTRGVKLEDGKVYRKIDPDGILGILSEETEI